MTLLNRAMYKYTATLGVRFDPTHRRFYFPAEEARAGASHPLPPAEHGKRRDGRSPGSPSGIDRRRQGFLVAPGCRAPLSPDGRRPVVPEHPTGAAPDLGRRDAAAARADRPAGDEPEGPDVQRQVSERSQLLAGLPCQGSPRFVLDFGSQSAVISTEFLTFDVAWPGIPGDDLPFKNQSYEEDLFSLAGLGSVVEGEDLDWDDETTTTTTPIPNRLLPLELMPAQDDRRVAGRAGPPVRRREDGTSTRRPASPSTAHGPWDIPPQAGGARRLHRHERVGRRRTQVLRQMCSGVPGDERPRTVPRL